jgi:outer membrane protein assembly factor BamA
LGLVTNWDSRDNTFAAYSGSFYQVTLLFNQRVFGSDYNYSDVQLDFRNFFEVAPGHIVALQAGGEFMGGDVPFQNLARFGGQNVMRGYFAGRYRDKHMAGIQAEYRFPVWWRFGLAGFAGAAQVADRISHLGLRRFWFAGGAGIRFAWNPEERVNLRLDYGIGNNSDGIYITVTEAF